ncbi:MmcQ/YjbR family DNA-binding protein [Lactococcus lactis]|uniref:MmcQ/YjbR family DNA-binding protein n=1 Tax=Lactococcus lactis TaxID=1358 RepID=UPI002415B652|nr:MmcQ/YjbR family DNA-binding protein [Lactococcus lactis]MDG4969512.1 MmcQ/YjbR family DNA-binding protein [Lactococcus lactis]MDG5102739.1 MmcQ/YjbR family DNA-binding protein [Lactococcus lactis]
MSLSNSYEDYPFNDNRHEKILWTAIRQKKNKKILALIFEKEGELLIDLKLIPEHGEEVRQYEGVYSGYHMNKLHWNTVRVNNTTLSYDGLIKMIKESDNLTK